MEKAIARLKTTYKGTGFFSLNRMLSAYIFIGLCAVAGIINKDFFLWSTWQSLLQSMSNMGVVAIGTMVVIISGGLDFTAEQGVAASAAFAGIAFLQSNYNIYITFLVAIMAAVFIGLLNGIVITKLKIQPFVVTLANMSLCQGLAFFLNEGRNVNLMLNENFNVLSSTLLFKHQTVEIIGGSEVSITYGFPLSFVIFLLVALLGYLLMNKTRMGTYVYAMGGREESVVYAGINLKLYKMLVYVFAGFCTGIGACITISRVGAIAANTTGATLMDIVGAVIIGGTSVSGGRGYIFGTIMGVLIIGVISQLFFFLDIPTLWRDVFKGLVILFALVIDRAINRIGSRKKAVASA